MRARGLLSEKVDSENGNVRFPAIRLKLLELSRRDQEARRSLGNNPSKMEMKALDDIDKESTSYINELLNKKIEPSRENIGLDGSRAYWLLAQHSNVEIMRKTLYLMRRLYKKNKNSVFYQGIPFLHDRVNVLQGKKQYFGTQFFLDKKGKEQIFPIHRTESVNDRRKNYGLGLLNAD